MDKRHFSLLAALLAAPAFAQHAGHGARSTSVDDVRASAVPLIPGKFKPGPWIKRAGVPGDAGRDPNGAFRLICFGAAWIKQVDPLVQPGAKVASHLHTGWGNDSLDENSTYATLRAKGSSNCQGGPLYRSAGWAPSLLDGNTVIVPDYVSTYYKRRPASDPRCREVAAKGCAEFPAGLRFIVGRNYAVNGPPNANITFRCAEDKKRSWAAMAAEPGCLYGKRIKAVASAPSCWDGVRIDSPDHQSHLAYAQRNRQTGRTHCPVTHPYLIPQFTVTMVWTIGEREDPARWTFAVDRMMGTPAGTWFHIDYWEAQEPFARKAWHEHCIDRHLNCSAGVMGNGMGFQQPPGASFKVAQRRVKAPAGAVLDHRGH